VISIMALVLVISICFLVPKAAGQSPDSDSDLLPEAIEKLAGSPNSIHVPPKMARLWRDGVLRRSEM
jgi:hypothetical protein